MLAMLDLSSMRLGGGAGNGPVSVTAAAAAAGRGPFSEEPQRHPSCELSTTSSTSTTSFASSSSSSSSSKKSVRWSDDETQVHDIIHRDDIPEDMVRDIWYDAEDYNQMKRSYQMTLFLMSQATTEQQVYDLLASNEHTIRGLEFRTREGFYARMEKRRDSCTAVLEEQSRQWDEQCDQDEMVYNDEMIARMYRRFTYTSTEEAILRAKHDAQEAALAMAADAADDTDNQSSRQRQQQHQQQQQRPPSLPQRSVSARPKSTTPRSQGRSLLDMAQSVFKSATAGGSSSSSSSSFASTSDERDVTMTDHSTSTAVEVSTTTTTTTATTTAAPRVRSLPNRSRSDIPAYLSLQQQQQHQQQSSQGQWERQPQDTQPQQPHHLYIQQQPQSQPQSQPSAPAPAPARVSVPTSASMRTNGNARRAHLL